MGRQDRVALGLRGQAGVADVRRLVVPGLPHRGPRRRGDLRGEPGPGPGGARRVHRGERGRHRRLRPTSRPDVPDRRRPEHRDRELVPHPRHSHPLLHRHRRPGQGHPASAPFPGTRWTAPSRPSSTDPTDDRSRHARRAPPDVAAPAPAEDDLPPSVDGRCRDRCGDDRAATTDAAVTAAAARPRPARPVLPPRPPAAAAEPRAAGCSPCCWCWPGSAAWPRSPACRCSNWTETADFCGRCHTMAPELAAYEAGPHRDVACAECHVEPGIAGWIKAKLNGTRQLVEVVLGTFPDADPAARPRQPAQLRRYLPAMPRGGVARRRHAQDARPCSPRTRPTPASSWGSWSALPAGTCSTSTRASTGTCCEP